MGLISVATLILQIALIRVFSVAQWYYFVFLSVSVALLGVGASGSILSVRPPSIKRGEANSLCAMSPGFALSATGGCLALYYLFLVMSFFSGLVIGSLLQMEWERVGLLIGVPVPKDIVSVGREAPEFVSYAWGVNGYASMSSSILSRILSISFGFSTVLLLARTTYAMALVVIYPLWGKEPGS